MDINLIQKIRNMVNQHSLTINKIVDAINNHNRRLNALERNDIKPDVVDIEYRVVPDKEKRL